MVFWYTSGRWNANKVCCISEGVRAGNQISNVFSTFCYFSVCKMKFFVIFNLRLFNSRKVFERQFYEIPKGKADLSYGKILS